MEQRGATCIDSVGQAKRRSFPHPVETLAAKQTTDREGARFSTIATCGDCVRGTPSYVRKWLCRIVTSPSAKIRFRQPVDSPVPSRPMAASLERPVVPESRRPAHGRDAMAAAG